jgi:hypothetical protein
VARPVGRARLPGVLGAELRSRGFILASIVALAALYLVGLVVPQRENLAPAAYDAWRSASPRLVRALEVTGAVDVYRAPVMWLALALFFLSLGAVLLDRVPRLVRRTRLDHGVPLDPGALAARKGTRAVPVASPAAALDRIAAVLEARGYAVHRRPGALRGVRFRWAPLGFVAFHGAFGLLLAAGVAIDLTRFSGVAHVAEGERFVAADGPWRDPPRRPRLGGRAPALAFDVLAVRPRYEGGHPIRLDADVLLAGESQPRRVGVNAPVHVGSASLMLMDAAAAPLVTCDGPDGASDGAWVKLARGIDARFAFPACGVEVLARPVARGAAGPGTDQRMAAGTRVEELQDGLEVAIRDATGAVTPAVLRAGQGVAVAGGRVRVAMPEVHRYGVFQVIDERGGALLWAAFVAGLAGLVARLVLYRREIVAAAAPDGRVLLAAAADGIAGGGPEGALEDACAAAASSSSSGPSRPSSARIDEDR